MKILTKQEFDLVNCCDACSMQEEVCIFDLECESISLTLVGYDSTGYYDLDITPDYEDVCAWYKTKTITFEDVYGPETTGAESAPAGNTSYRYERDSYQNDQYIDWTTPAGVKKKHTVRDDIEVSTTTRNSDGSVLADTTKTFFAEYTTDGGCTSLSTLVDNVTPANNYSIAGTTGCITSEYLGSYYTYVGPHSFEYEYDFPPLYQKLTVSFGEKIDVAFVKSRIDLLDFPADTNGSACASSIIPAQGTCISPKGGTKVRYRFKLPVDYTRSYYEVQWDIVLVPLGGPPALLGSSSWVYAGGSLDSPWFDLEMPAVVGTVKIANILSKSYKDTVRGVKPCSHGEVIEFPDESLSFSSPANSMYHPLL